MESKMDMREYCKMQVERSKDHLSKHLDYMIDEIEEEHRHFTMSEIKELKDILEAMHHARELMM
jgi:hypothetical protein